MKSTEKKGTTRRDFLKRTGVIATGVLGVPTIVPRIVFGAEAPSEKNHHRLYWNGPHGSGGYAQRTGIQSGPDCGRL